jgi:hypothetical protein
MATANWKFGTQDLKPKPIIQKYVISYKQELITIEISIRAHYQVCNVYLAFIKV